MTDQPRMIVAVRRGPRFGESRSLVDLLADALDGRDPADCVVPSAELPTAAQLRQVHRDLARLCRAQRFYTVRPTRTPRVGWWPADMEETWPQSPTR